MSKHTPGPWGVVAYGLHGRMKVTAGSMPVASIASANHDASFNARLISAAPDLLEALEELADLVDLIRSGQYTPDSFTTQPARTAIAKATGEKA